MADKPFIFVAQTTGDPDENSDVAYRDTRPEADPFSDGVPADSSNPLSEISERYEQNLRRSPNDPDIHLRFASEALEFVGVKDMAPVVTALTRAVTLRPGWFDAHYLLGCAYSAAHRRDLAIHSFNRALLIKPSDLDALNALTYALLRESRYDEALRTAERIVSAHPRVALSHFTHGLTRLAAGAIEEAAQSFRSTMRIEDEFVEALYFLAIIALIADDQAMFDDYYARLTRHDAQLAETLVELSQWPRASLRYDLVIREILARGM